MVDDGAMNGRRSTGHADPIGIEAVPLRTLAVPGNLLPERAS
jgi:hypothetical protein